MDFKTFFEQEAGVNPSLDMLDTVDGAAWLYHHSNPTHKFKVVALFDAFGEEITDMDIDEAVELAIGGVVELGASSFQTFAL